MYGTLKRDAGIALRGLYVINPEVGVFCSCCQWHDWQPCLRGDRTRHKVACPTSSLGTPQGRTIEWRPAAGAALAQPA